jgi:uncharacterized protein (TIGR03083 family)
METAEYIEVLDRQGKSLAHAASEAGLNAMVPTCPGWQVRDLLRHTGKVHRWAAAFVTEGYTSHHPGRPVPDGLEDTALLSWFDDGHTVLVEALRAAPGDLECWTFLPAPSARVFWARRQAHETTLHRTDAESARGAQPDGIGTELAVDGIEELLTGFHRRSGSKVRTDTPGVLRIRAVDTDDVWTLRLSETPLVTERGAAGDADCEVSGPVTDLYLALWNRLPFPAVIGDTALADLWRERSGI